MDAVAAGASVSVKTIYSHFHSKSDLFSAVMKQVCSHGMRPNDLRNADALHSMCPWFNDTSQRGLRRAGKAYLEHLLSPDQLALYRVVTRDGYRSPELGEQYRNNIARGRTELLITFLDHMAQVQGWRRRDLRRDGHLYEALLRVDIFEQALHGLVQPEREHIRRHARAAANTRWTLLQRNPSKRSA